MLWEGIRLYSREQYAQLPPSIRFILTKDVQKYLHPDIPDRYLNKSLLLIQDGDSYEIEVEGENFLVVDDYVDGFIVIGRWEAQRKYKNDMRECQNRGSSLISNLYQSEQDELISKITGKKPTAKKTGNSRGLLGVLRRGLTGPAGRTTRTSSSEITVATGTGHRRLPRNTPVATTVKTREDGGTTARKRPAARTTAKAVPQKRTSAAKTASTRSTSTKKTSTAKTASTRTAAKKTDTKTGTKTAAKKPATRTAAKTTAQKKTASTSSTRAAAKKPATRTTAQKKTSTARTASTRSTSTRKTATSKTSVKKDAQKTTRSRSTRK